MDGNERQSFVMYASFLEAAENLEPAAFKECILKLRDYALYGQDVLSRDPVVNIILTMAKPNLNAAAARYQRCVDNGKKGKEHGSKGGRPRKGETREEYDIRRGKTPRKPLDVDENEKVNENEKDNDELIQSPAAMEPARGSGSSIGLSLPISIESIFKADSTGSPSNDDISLIRHQHSNMSERELVNRYEQAIDKVALARANKERYKHEALLAMEAALICQRLDKLPTLDEAKRLVVEDINAAVQQIREARKAEVDKDESDDPF
ncbi:MAG: hypothetical protein IJ603_08960 [Bacteroidales bacterium]|nr:hypothetical protein [Bacteroidales bacterium]MBR1577904.1 hypothetical protein [Bacteroidales bacterium]